MRALERIARWTLGLGVVAIAGCADEPTTVIPAEGTVGAEQIAGPPKPFGEMSVQEQKDYMMELVMPIMQGHFQAFDDDMYAEFGCPTCHGPEPDERDFKMPDAALPSLPAPDTAEWDEMMQEPSSLVLFMQNDVVPTMAALLGKPAFDPATGEGFGCLDCHTTRAAPGSGVGVGDPGPALEDELPQ
jgi:hypothetical protein